MNEGLRKFRMVRTVLRMVVWPGLINQLRETPGRVQLEPGHIIVKWR
jgi:hypothetical protein